MNSAITFLPQAATPAESPQGGGFKSPVNADDAHHSFSNALDRAVGQPQHDRGEKSLKPDRSSRGDSSESRVSSDVKESGDRFAARRKDNERDEKQSLAGACAVTAQVATPTETPAAKQESPHEAECDALPTGLTQLADVSVAESAENADAPVQLTDSKVQGEANPMAASMLARLLEPAGETIDPIIPETTRQIASPGATMAKESPVTTSAGENGDQIFPKSEDQLASSASTMSPTKGMAEADVALVDETVSGERAEQVAQSQTEPALPVESRRATRAVRRAVIDALENSRGMAAAKMAVEMKTTTKKEEIAGLTEQILPGTSSAQLPAMPNLPSGVRRDVLEKISSGDALGAAERISPAPAHSDVSEAGDKMGLRSASPVVRVGELISREVRMFKRSADDLVEVVLTPDAKTQISLRLQWRDGRVEVQARCDLGDYQSLNTQWAQLQASMANHGVRLSHLTERVPTGFTEFFSNPNFSQQQGGEQRPSEKQGSVMPITAPVAQPVKSAPPKSVGRMNRLLESWA